MQTHREQTNIRTAYFLACISEIFFPIAIWLFFYTQFLDFKQIALLTGICGLAALLFEVPTGAFADIYGRKTAIVLSYILFSASMLGVAFSHTFEAFLVLGIMSALSNALYSGSLEALVYDSLKESGKEHIFERVVSRMEALTWVGLCIGSVVGGFLYQINFRLPYLVQAASMAIAAIAALWLQEPQIDSQKFHLKQLVTQNTAGFKELFRTNSTAITSLIFITIGAGYYVASQMLGISQAKQYGISPSGVGILFGAGYILSAVASHFFPNFRKVLGSRTLLVLSVVALLTSFLLANFVNMTLGALLIILRIASSTTFRNGRSIIFNRIFSSKNRATALSTLNLLSNLPYVVFAYLIGDTIDKTSPNQFSLVLGVLLFAVLTLLVIVRKVHVVKQMVN